MTQAEYADFETRFAQFMEREGINCLSSLGFTPEFSWQPCECCQIPLGGDRYRASGYNPHTQEIQYYNNDGVCFDCLYYATYGQLDDMTMMNMEE